MTRHPLKWLADVLPFADLVIVHAEIDDSLETVLQHIRQAGCQTGLCLRMGTPSATARSWLDRLNVICC